MILLNGKLRKRNLLIEGKSTMGISETPYQDGNIIDCKGQWILPGAIDPHVHFRTPGGEHKEDWKTGSKAAVAGGITTVLDMPNTNPPTTTSERLNEKRKIAKANSLCNFGFYFGASINNLDEIEKINNIAAIKIYFGSTTGNLLVNDSHYLTDLIKKTRFPLAFHAENEALMKKNISKIKDLNKAGARIHGVIRDEEVARSAVEEIIALANDHNVKIYLCHVSTQREFELIERAKQSMDIYCEVTPHHLFLNEELLDRIGHFGKVNPPLRKEVDRKFLYNALIDGRIDTIGTDHAPHLKKEKMQEYLKAPSGLPGLETMLPLLLTEVYHGNLTIDRLAQLTGGNTAKFFSLKNKGSLAPGYDADIVVVNPDKSYSLTSERLYTKVGWNPFEGRTLYGEIDQTIVLGQLAYKRGRFFSVHGEEVKYDIKI